MKEWEILDHKTYIESFIWIKSKKKRRVPFILNPVQADYMESKTGMDIVLKARQHGFSTLILADFYVDTIMNEATNTKIIAHKKDAAQGLLENLKIMYQNTPDEYKPQLGYDNKYEFEFPELNSRITIGVATKAGDAGRSETINNLLCTEVAFWKGASDTMAGLLEAVPQEGNVVIESTPNGIGNYFHKTVLQARAGESAFKLHEYGWWVNPEYMRPLIPGYIEARTKEEEQLAIEKRQLILSEEEQKIVKQLGLTFEQINWRRWKMKQAPNPRTFYQENELNFNQSGRPVIDYQYIEPYKEHGLKYRKPLLIDTYEVWWETPEASGAKYLVTADTSEGVDGGDYSVIQIFKVCEDYKVRQVYRFRGLVKPTQLATRIDKIVRMFAKEGQNLVILGVERNNHGHAVIVKLVEFQTPGLYFFDNGKPGWDTNSATKPIMVNEFEEAIREGYMEIYDQVTLGEMEGFEWKDNGTAGAPDDDDFHDDTVIAAAIAWQMRKATKYHIFWPYDYAGDRTEATVIG